MAAYRHVAIAHGLRIPPPREVQSHLGKPIIDIYASLYPNRNLEDLLLTNSAFIAANAMRSEAFAGGEQVLGTLQAQGFRLAIVTSGNHKVVDLLRHHHIDTYFTSIVHHERVRHSKPDPEGFNLAVHECDAEPGRSIMVGDMPVDIQTGMNGGAYATIGITHGYGRRSDLQRAGATYLADDLYEVQRIVDSLSGPNSILPGL